MNSKETPTFISDSLKFGIKLGLDRMQELSKRMGNPQDKLQFVHVAGTNGKGSTVTYISSILSASNLKVGVFTSPFLERFSERMRVIDSLTGLQAFTIDESYGEISSEDLSRISSKVEKTVADMVRDGYEHPTEFELVTMIAYLWFLEQNTDIVVLETGLGGRFDSTNIIKSPLCCAITAIGMDHTECLGDTIAKIAFEKAGIIKPNCPCVVSEPNEMLLDSQQQKNDVREVFEQVTTKLHAPLHFCAVGDYSYKVSSSLTMSFDYKGDSYETMLLGEHQIKNAVLAIETCKIISERFNQINSDTIKLGIKLARWKGRAEVISREPLVLLDGGHNPQCMESLVQTLNDIFEASKKPRKLRMVIGVMKDKDFSGMLTVLRDSQIEIADFTAVLVDNPRSMKPSEICNSINLVYNNEVKIECFDIAQQGVKAAIALSKEDSLPLLVAGSLYLIGSIRQVIKESV